MDALLSLASLGSADSATLSLGVTSSSQTVILFVVIAACALLLISTRRRLSRGGNSPRAYAREQIRQIKEERRVSHEVQGVMVELEELARQVHGQIDTRIAKLQAATRAADQRIETLERLIDRHDEAPADHATDKPDRTAALGSGGDKARARIVHNLSDAGLTSIEIAQRVGIPPGEVELILAVRARCDSPC
jgi:hypothetical protein